MKNRLPFNRSHQATTVPRYNKLQGPNIQKTLLDERKRFETVEFLET
jgi:hypothetical protein